MRNLKLFNLCEKRPCKIERLYYNRFMLTYLCCHCGIQDDFSWKAGVQGRLHNYHTQQPAEAICLSSYIQYKKFSSLCE